MQNAEDPLTLLAQVGLKTYYTTRKATKIVNGYFLMTNNDNSHKVSSVLICSGFTPSVIRNDPSPHPLHNK